MRLKVISGMMLVSIILGVMYWKMETQNMVKVTEAESYECLNNSDCRARLEAAVNEIYAESGYPTTTLDVMISGARSGSAK